MIDSKNLLSDAELDKVAGGMTEKEAAGVMNGCLNSKDGSFVFGGIKYNLNTCGQTIDEELTKMIVAAIQEAEGACVCTADPEFRYTGTRVCNGRRISLLARTM